MRPKTHRWGKRINPAAAAIKGLLPELYSTEAWRAMREAEAIKA